MKMLYFVINQFNYITMSNYIIKISNNMVFITGKVV